MAKVLNKMWELGRKLGNGANGEVYEARKLNGDQSDYPYVAKIAPIPANAQKPSKKKRKKTQEDRNFDSIYKENILYRNFFNNFEFIPKAPLYGFGDDKEHNLRFLIIERLDRTMIQSFQDSGCKFSLSKLAEYGLNLLQSLRYIHSKKYVYIDVKPENFMVGRPGTPYEKKMCIVDFGISEKYVNYLSAHKEHVVGDWCGTPLYLSLGANKGQTPARRDDIEGLGMVLTYFLRGGNLPWEQADSEADLLLIKEQTSPSELCDQFVGGSYLRDFLLEARNMAFEEEPNYDEFTDLLMKLKLLHGNTGESALSSAAAADDDSQAKKPVPVQDIASKEGEKDEEKEQKEGKGAAEIASKRACHPPPTPEEGGPSNPRAKKRNTGEREQTVRQSGRGAKATKPAPVPVLAVDLNTRDSESKDKDKGKGHSGTKTRSYDSVVPVSPAKVSDRKLKEKANKAAAGVKPPTEVAGIGKGKGKGKGRTKAKAEAKVTGKASTKAAGEGEGDDNDGDVAMAVSRPPLRPVLHVVATGKGTGLDDAVFLLQPGQDMRLGRSRPSPFPSSSSSSSSSSSPSVSSSKARPARKKAGPESKSRKAGGNNDNDNGEGGGKGGGDGNGGEGFLVLSGDGEVSHLHCLVRVVTLPHPHPYPYPYPCADTVTDDTAKTAKTCDTVARVNTADFGGAAPYSPPFPLPSPPPPFCLLVEDLGSTNGTYLRRNEAGPYYGLHVAPHLPTLPPSITTTSTTSTTTTTTATTTAATTITRSNNESAPPLAPEPVAAQALHSGFSGDGAGDGESRSRPRPKLCRRKSFGLGENRIKITGPAKRGKGKGKAKGRGDVGGGPGEGNAWGGYIYPNDGLEIGSTLLRFAFIE